MILKLDFVLLPFFQGELSAGLRGYCLNCIVLKKVYRFIINPAIGLQVVLCPELGLQLYDFFDNSFSIISL